MCEPRCSVAAFDEINVIELETDSTEFDASPIVEGAEVLSLTTVEVGVGIGPEPGNPGCSKE